MTQCLAVLLVSRKYMNFLNLYRAVVRVSLCVVPPLAMIPKLVEKDLFVYVFVHV